MTTNLLENIAFVPNNGTGTGNWQSFTYTEDNTSNQHGVDAGATAPHIQLSPSVYVTQATFKMHGPAARATSLGVWSYADNSYAEVDDPFQEFGPPILAASGLTVQSWRVDYNTDGTATITIIIQIPNQIAGSVYLYQLPNNYESNAVYQGDGITSVTFTSVLLQGSENTTLPVFPGFVPPAGPVIVAAGVPPSAPGNPRISYPPT